MERPPAATERTGNEPEAPAGDSAVTANLPVIQENAATLNDLIDISCRKFRDLPAIGMALEEPLSYTALHERILALAAHLQALGVKPGDRIAILGENSHHWGIAYLATVRLGASTVPIFPELPEADVHHILTEMRCEIIFLTHRQIEKIYDLKHQLKHVVTLDDYRDDTGLIPLETFTDFLGQALERYGETARDERLEFPPVKGDDLASILFTSGTSGFSKAVMLTRQPLRQRLFGQRGRVHPRAPVGVPLGPAGGPHLRVHHRLSPAAVVRRAHRLCRQDADPGHPAEDLRAGTAPRHAGGAPDHREDLQEAGGAGGGEERPAHLPLPLRRQPADGAPQNRRQIARLLRRPPAGHGHRRRRPQPGGGALPARRGLPFLVGYGLTEGSPLLAGGPHGDTTITPGSSGKPVPRVEIRIDDPHPQTGVGEIVARGPNIMQGYLNDPEATRDTFTEDGWLRTGDLGLLDSGGNLHIKGRSKSMIVLSNGENVFPEAIEHKVNTYPFVMESMVIENRGLLEAWVYPDYEFIDSRT